MLLLIIQTLFWHRRWERERRKRSQRAKKSLQHLQLKKKKQTSSHTLHPRTYLDWFQLSSTLSAEQRNIISSHKLCVCRAQSNFFTCMAALLLPDCATPRGNCCLDNPAATYEQGIARVLLCVCVCVYLMNRVILDDGVRSIWTWLIM